jgi:3-keto-5-aminohexanoate cleavage enzyme
MALGKMIVEAAINEGVTKAENPSVPYGPEEVAREAIACARAGASIVHFHARDTQTGANLLTSAETYAEAFRLVQKVCDVLLLPTVPAGSKGERIGHILTLARDPDIRFNFMNWDLGSTNYSHRYLPETRSFVDPNFVLVHTHADTAYFLQTCRDNNIRCRAGIREPGHLRHLLVYLEMGLIEPPLFLNLMLSDYDPFGLPPCAKSLQVFLDLIPPEVETHWMINTNGPSHLQMNMLAAAMGGHVRTGVGDNPVINGRQLSNVEQVKLAVGLAVYLGREVATAADVRQMLRIPG